MAQKDSLMSTKIVVAPGHKLLNGAIVIPEMTMEQQHAWIQPQRTVLSFEVDDVSPYMAGRPVYKVYMRQADLDLLPQYDRSMPSGVYPGKMWKQLTDDAWFLCWYDDEPLYEDRCAVRSTPVMLLELLDLIQNEMGTL